MARKEEIFSKLLFNTVVFENVLKTFKVEYYRELKLNFEAKLKLAKSLPKGKEKTAYIKELSEKLSLYKKRLETSSKYNQEVSKDFEKFSSSKFNFDIFTENTVDLYISFSNLLIDLSKSPDMEESDMSIVPCILKECEGEGDIAVNNKNYKLIL
jgi:hypothetical protein